MTEQQEADVTTIKELLRQELDVQNGTALALQIAQIEAWQGYLSELHRKAARTLEEKRGQYLLPKDKEYTDVDRKVKLDQTTAQFQEVSDHLGDLQEIIQRRVSLGQTLLKNLRTEMQSGFGDRT